MAEQFFSSYGVSETDFPVPATVEDMSWDDDPGCRDSIDSAHIPVASRPSLRDALDTLGPSGQGGHPYPSPHVSIEALGVRHAQSLPGRTREIHEFVTGKLIPAALVGVVAVAAFKTIRKAL